MSESLYEKINKDRTKFTYWISLIFILEFFLIPSYPDHPIYITINSILDDFFWGTKIYPLPFSDNRTFTVKIIWYTSFIIIPIASIILLRIELKKYGHKVIDSVQKKEAQTLPPLLNKETMSKRVKTHRDFFIYDNTISSISVNLLAILLISLTPICIYLIELNTVENSTVVGYGSGGRKLILLLKQYPIFYCVFFSGLQAMLIILFRQLFHKVYFILKSFNQ